MAFYDGQYINDDPLAVLDDAAGTNVSDRLVEAYGGTRLYIVKNVTKDCDLTKVLGIQDAKLISKALGGLSCDIPKRENTNSAQSREQIRLLLLADTKISEISRLVNYSERSVYRVKSQLIERGLLPEKSSKTKGSSS